MLNASTLRTGVKPSISNSAAIGRNQARSHADWKTDSEAIDRFRRNSGVGDKGWYGRRYRGFEYAYAGGKIGVMELRQHVPIRVDRPHVDRAFQNRVEDPLHGA